MAIGLDVTQKAGLAEQCKNQPVRPSQGLA